jgi:hypothetical protein
MSKEFERGTFASLAVVSFVLGICAYGLDVIPYAGLAMVSCVVATCGAVFAE